MTKPAAKPTTDPLKVREAKRAFYAGTTNILRSFRLAPQLSPGLVLSFVNVSPDMPPQEKTTQGKADITRQKAFSMFVVPLFDMTWRLLIAMAVPVLLGAFLDKKLATDDLFTAFGFLLSLVAAGFVIKSTVDKLKPEDTE